MSKRVQPYRRFNSYKSEWEYEKLGTLSSIVTGGTPSTKVEDYWYPKEVHWLSSGEINNKRIKDTEDKISLKGFNNSSARYIRAKSVLIALAGQGKTRGKVAINEIDLTTNQSIAAILPKENLDYEFLYQNLIKRYHELRSKSSGDGTRGGLNKNILQELDIIHPTLSEQQKIGEFFKLLDARIANQKRKIEKIKALKQAYLTEMFPQEDENVPKRRFKRFQGSWDCASLGEVCRDFTYGLNVKATDYDGVNKYLRITDIDDKSRRFKKNNLTSPKLINNSEEYLLQQGDILFARTGASVGKTYQYNLRDGKVYFAGFLIRARVLVGYDSNFIFYLTLTKRYRKFVSVTSQRSGQPGINADEYKAFCFYIPNYKEQQKIGEFFKTLDEKIESEEKKLEKLKKMKEAFLEEMFV